jgi:Sulfotransferase family
VESHPVEGSEGFVHYLLQRGGEDAPWAQGAAIKVARAYYRDRWRLSPRRLDRLVDCVPLDRPIFLLGTQGSGATLIGRCLRRNARVVTVSGGRDNWTGIDELGIVRNRMARLPASLWGSSFRHDIADATFGASHNSVFACTELLPFYRATADDATGDAPERFRRLLREHIAVFSHDPENARFLDKTHAYTVKMPLIAALLEDTRPLFVLVVRNPYGACTWALERKSPSFGSAVAAERRLRLIADHWANAHRVALEDARLLGNTAVVRFEDFLADPAEIVRGLCAFTGLEYDGSMIPAPGQPRPFGTLPADRKWFPLYEDDRLGRAIGEQMAVVYEHCEELALHFGYTPEGSIEPGGPIGIVGGRAVVCA